MASTCQQVVDAKAKGSRVARQKHNGGGRATEESTRVRRARNEVGLLVSMPSRRKVMSTDATIDDQSTTLEGLSP
jgi:hypothetical protein